MNTAVDRPPQVVKGQQDPKSLHTRGTADLRQPRLAFGGPLGKQPQFKPPKVKPVAMKPLKIKTPMASQPSVSLRSLVRPMRTL